ncbi:MAG: hypothetical protein HYS23_00100 [Geobacter sp.]|nr:hypothetical protein [Geobacter sp.]
MQSLNEHSRLKRLFVVAGAAVGAVLSGWYLFRNIAPGSAKAIPDPIWARFVNVALIMFSAIYLMNLLRRFIERGIKGKRQ